MLRGRGRQPLPAWLDGTFSMKPPMKDLAQIDMKDVLDVMVGGIQFHHSQACSFVFLLRAAPFMPCPCLTEQDLLELGM